MTTSKNSKGQIFKLTTNSNLDFTSVKKVATKHDLVITINQDFLTLTFAGKKTGLRSENITSPDSYNQWSLITGTSFDELEFLQPVFNDLITLDGRGLIVEFPVSKKSSKN